MMASDGVPKSFGVALEELRVLMEHRGHEGYQKIQNDHGGVLELCKKLYTSPNEGKRAFCGFNQLYILNLIKI